jgi:RNA polymerase-binding transcription factor DksA
VDDADRASIEIEREIANALNRARKRIRARSDRCIDCGDELPAHRREWELCVPCAEDRERLERIAGVSQ